MPVSKIAGYGSWKSPLTAELILTQSLGLGQLALDGQSLYWVESRPQEQGRNVIVKRSPDGIIVDVTPPQFNVRTRVHEYGGGAFVVENGAVYFANYSDQRVYAQLPGAAPFPVTPPGRGRFADLVFDKRRHRLIGVCEDHSSNEVLNYITGIDLESGGGVQRLVHGHDFFSSPRISPDGSQLVWLSWDHPDMPWDSTALWIAGLRDDGSLVQPRKVAGGRDESICQPDFSPDGTLYFISDRNGWWNLYRRKDERIEALCEMEAEFGGPQWTFGASWYGFETPDRIICTLIQKGISYLGSLDLKTRRLEAIDSPFTAISALKAAPGLAVVEAGSPQTSAAIFRLNLANNQTEIVRRSSNVNIDPGYLSLPQPVEFATENSLTAYAFYYPPMNQDFAAPQGERPPLMVLSHGGPTGAASNALNLNIQYWTSRGFAVVSVNYGGSTGYGRAYRLRLNGCWGIVDVDDCLNAARYLIGRGQADPRRTVIRGSSAGGYTALCALTFRQFFQAGAVYYGISDLEAMEKETHKFESRYQHRLIGPYPECQEIFRQRSPLNFADRLSSPVIFFQGAEDKVVPPGQSEMMVEALRRKGIPVAYLLFEHEQHGFRQAANIRRALEAELYFYSRVLGFEPADAVEPVRIDNLT